jgi:hypothetical protein
MSTSNSNQVLEISHFANKPNLRIGCARGFLGRMRETKITDTEVNWLYSVLIAKQPIDPTHPMITGGVVKQHRV